MTLANGTLEYSLIRIGLRHLIWLLALLSALVSLGSTLYASYQAQNELLVEKTLQTNQAYATKLASTVEDFIQSSWQRLAYSARQLQDGLDNPDILQSEVDRLWRQISGFNTVVAVNAQGLVRATSPESIPLIGRILSSPGALEALKERRPLVSRPYISATNNLVVFVSYPIVTEEGQYLGYIGGSLYLKKTNQLHELFGEHWRPADIHLYVVDLKHHLIYDSSTDSKLGEVVEHNPVLDALEQREYGQLNYSGSLAGYAAITSAGWGVVVESSANAIYADLETNVWHIFYDAMPLVVLGLLAGYLLAFLIARPLNCLAQTARNMDGEGALEQVYLVQPWYFEVAQLRQSMLAGIGLLHQKVPSVPVSNLIDPVTGLKSQQGLIAILDTWQESRSFSIIALAIDGCAEISNQDAKDHAMGQVAQLMRESARATDVLCRFKDDVLLALLPGTSLADASRVAERLRLRVELADIVVAGVGVTLLLGVSYWSLTTEISVQVIVQTVVQALEEAQQQGRRNFVITPIA